MPPEFDAGDVVTFKQSALITNILIQEPILQGKIVTLV